MASDTGRRDILAGAVTAELERQGQHAVDVEALVAVIEIALTGGAMSDAAEGKRPDELNATNDD